VAVAADSIAERFDVFRNLGSGNISILVDSFLMRSFFRILKKDSAKGGRYAKFGTKHSTAAAAAHRAQTSQERDQLVTFLSWSGTTKGQQTSLTLCLFW
jgi:hypothetical protein